MGSFFLKKLTFGQLLLFYVLVTSCFLCLVFLAQRTYDVWILDGILIPTIVFVVFSVTLESFVKEAKQLALLASLFLIALNIIPGLKYPLFYGVYDSPAHYRFTSQLVALGHVPQDEFYSRSYGSNPDMHILMACFSIIPGISVNDVFRFIVPALFGLVPLIAYFITKDIIDSRLQKYVIIASSLPVVAGYEVFGTSLALIPFFLLLGVFLRCCFVQTDRKLFFLVFVILAFRLVTSHAVTAFFTSVLLVGCFLALVLLKELGKKSAATAVSHLSFAPGLFFMVLLWGWWMNNSIFNLDTFTELITNLLGSATPAIPTRFYEIPLLAQLQVLVVLHLSTAIVLILSLIGLFIFLRRPIKNMSTKERAFYSCIIVILSLVVFFVSVQLALNFGALQYSRFIAYAMPLSIFLGGLALGSLHKEFDKVFSANVSRFTFACLLSLVGVLCLIQFFPFQPLVPKANAVSKSLPESQYLVDLVIINTVYQKDMIFFAQNHSTRGLIASDAVTSYQVYGFSNSSFFSRQVSQSLLLVNSTQDLKWDLFLLHTTEAGPFQEKPEYRTEERIESLRLTAGNVIYDNGGSFIISHSLYNYYGYRLNPFFNEP